MVATHCITQFGKQKGKEMKKIFIILLCMITLNANATEMCARNDTVVIPLDSTINGGLGGSNGTEWLWWAPFEYGMLYGATACLSKKEVMMYSDWNGMGMLSKGNWINTASAELIGSQGYYMNADVDSDIPDSEKPDYERKYCFIQLTHPMLSVWVFANDYGLAGTCKTLCTGNIGGLWPASHSQEALRSAFFNTTGIVPPWSE